MANTNDVTVSTDRRDYRVSLTRAASVGPGAPAGAAERVIWEATPEFNESRSIMYKNIDPIHAPGAIYQYANTGSRTFSISGKFVSRSVNEATKNLAYIQYLRTWAMPVFGQKGTAVGEDILGAPPSILLLTAYSTGKPGSDSQRTVPTSNVKNLSRQQNAYGSNVYQIPVAITNLDIPFPSDVDYIPTINAYPIPTTVTVSLSLVETHSPNKYQSFNIQDFKTGNLINF